MQSKATTVEDYLNALPDDRREALEAIRKVILENLPDGYEEGMQYGMIGYFVPHSVYPAGYHCDPTQPLPFASLASQKNHMAIYLMCIYSDENRSARFRKAWVKAGKKLDMGKSCVRFKKIEDVPLDVIGQTIKSVPAYAFIEHYESAVRGSASSDRRKRASSPRKPTPQSASTRTAPKKKAAKTTVPKKTPTRKDTAETSPRKTAIKKGAVAKKTNSKELASKKKTSARRTKGKVR